MKEVGGHSQSKETREKISNTLKAKPKEYHEQLAKNRIGVPKNKHKRKHQEDIDLPKYISSVRENGIIKGYAVTGILNVKYKKFCSSKLSIKEKLDLANKYLLDAITDKGN